MGTGISRIGLMMMDRNSDQIAELIDKLARIEGLVGLSAAQRYRI